MGVRKCPKCGSVWYTALVNCAFCGVEGEEVKGPISPAKLNLGKRGVESGPSPAEPAVPATVEAARPPAEAKAPEEPPKVEAPPPPEAPRPEPPKVEPPPPKVEEPVVEKKPEHSPVPSVARADEAIAVVKAKGYKPMTSKETPIVRSEPTAPAPQIPSSTVPLVFGALGLGSAALLPATWFVQHNKILTTFAVLAWAILAPFAPFAWLTAQRYADQCRSLGFSPAPAAGTGKLLGMAACFLTVFEFSGLAVFIVVQILNGRIVCPLWK